MGMRRHNSAEGARAEAAGVPAVQTLWSRCLPEVLCTECGQGPEMSGDAGAGMGFLCGSSRIRMDVTFTALVRHNAAIAHFEMFGGWDE